MLRMILWGFCFWVISLSNLQAQQRKLIIQGSSTAACVGPSNYTKCWVYILDSAFDVKESTEVIAVAQGGYTPYHSMPTGYVPPPNRPAPDPLKNISYSISLLPKVIIVSYPSNGYNVYTLTETMARLRAIKEAANAASIDCYIITPQPRYNTAGLPELNYNTSYTKQNMWAIRDSIMSEFGTFAINVWDTLVNPIDTTLKAEYDAGDRIHMNDAGHQFLARAVLRADVFKEALPIESLRFNGERLGNEHRLYWTYNGSHELQSCTLEWSKNGSDFQAIYQVQGGLKKYSFIHSNPADGHNWYRLRLQLASGKTVYSTRKNLYRNTDQLLIQQKIWRQDGWHLQVYAPKKETGSMTLVDLQGRLLWKETRTLQAGWQEIHIPVNGMAAREIQVLRLQNARQQVIEKLIPSH